MEKLPNSIYTGTWDEGHIQGIAMDTQRKFIYCSFTTCLVKLDMQGNLVGSVHGLIGHLGCLDFNDQDGRVYGSLEFKNDCIGQGILSRLSHTSPVQEGFYIAIFDVDKIVRPQMDAEADGIMTAVYLKDVVDDYQAAWTQDGKEIKHRYGCSGIDGLAFGPSFGLSKNTKYYLHVAYGIYGDLERTDNDYQVILEYDVSNWAKYERSLQQENMHHIGPERFRQRYFVFTGNTEWGIQNLEYDEYTGNWLMAVYRGRKPEYPNYSMFLIDGHAEPSEKPLQGFSVPQTGCVASLVHAGLHDDKSGIYGWEFPYGSTGIFSLGNGYFYFSQDRREASGYSSTIRLYQWTGKAPSPFELVE